MRNESAAGGAREKTWLFIFFSYNLQTVVNKKSLAKPAQKPLLMIFNK
jgi:hypothetical protein